MMADPVQRKWSLPPSWEAVPSGKDNRVYYWNKRTGATTWKFPEEEAKQHMSKIRRHTYENNMMKQGSSGSMKSIPSPGLQKVTQQWSPGQQDGGGQPLSGVGPAGIQISTSTKRGYENVSLLDPQSSKSQLPLYEEIEDVTAPTTPQSQFPRPLPSSQGRSSSEAVGRGRMASLPSNGEATSRGRMASLTSSSCSSDPTSPSPPMPDRKYLESDAIASPDAQDSRYTPPPELGASRRDSSNSRPPQHQLSAMGNEYAVINTRYRQKKHQKQQVGVVAEEKDLPSLPLRAHQRMSSREDLLLDAAEEEGGVVTVASGHEDGGDSIVSTSSSPTKNLRHDTIAYSVVKLDPMSGRLEVNEDLPPFPADTHSTSPQPYEVASPTPGSAQAMASPNPLYEEIEGEEANVSENGYMRVDHNRTTRPRGFSSPSSLDPVNTARDHSPLPDDSALSPTFSSLENSTAAYDLPSNSRKLLALGVTLRRDHTPQSDYAKLSLSKEALLLRSGVTLRRRTRESLSSVSSRAEGEGPWKNSGDSTDEDEPINKSVRIQMPPLNASRELSDLVQEEELDPVGFSLVATVVETLVDDSVSDPGVLGNVLDVVNDVQDQDSEVILRSGNSSSRIINSVTDIGRLIEINDTTNGSNVTLARENILLHVNIPEQLPDGTFREGILQVLSANNTNNDNMDSLTIKTNSLESSVNDSLASVFLSEGLFAAIQNTSNSSDPPRLIVIIYPQNSVFFQDSNTELDTGSIILSFERSLLEGPALSNLSEPVEFNFQTNQVQSMEPLIKDTLEEDKPCKLCVK